jgi:hypothetical protein
MICVQLNGGLGNQLFQYSMGLALSYEFNTGLLFDVNSLNNYNPKYTLRNFELNFFNNCGEIASLADMKLIRLSKYFKLAKYITGWCYINEKNTSYIEFSNKSLNNIYLSGYWQSEKYFRNIYDTIFTKITTINDDSLIDASLICELVKNSSVSIHVRRGDYVSLKSASSFHGVLGYNYYENAVNLIKSYIIAPKFFIFSDDIEWCKENLHIDGSVVFIDNSNLPSYVDLILMSHCYNSIIANSSFSWWGAWLGDRRNYSNRIVICPKKWYLEQLTEIDKIPKKWIEI